MIGKRANKVGLTKAANLRPMRFSLNFSSDVIQYKLGKIARRLETIARMLLIIHDENGWL
jgi:hypothetical protein